MMVTVSSIVVSCCSGCSPRTTARPQDTRTIQRQRHTTQSQLATGKKNDDIAHRSTTDGGTDALQPLFPDLNPLYLNLSTETAQPTAQSPKKQGTMKVVSIAILRTGPDVAEPVPVSMACELSSYGFFQRQVRQALPQNQRAEVN